MDAEDEAAASRGEIIRTWREQAGLSVRDLALKVGTLRQNIENIESGLVRHSRLLPKLAQVMGYTYEDLMELRAPPAKQPGADDALTLAQRVEIALEAGFRPGELAAGAGVTPAAVTQWRQSGTASLQAVTAVNLARMTGWSIEWWATGQGPRTAGEVPSQVPAQAESMGPQPAPLTEERKAAIADLLAKSGAHSLPPKKLVLLTLMLTEAKTLPEVAALKMAVAVAA